LRTRSCALQIELFFSWVKSKSKGLHGVRNDKDVRNVVYAGESLSLPFHLAGAA
jgi:hypothetical protein